MRQTTLPPEMLPSTGSQDVEIIVCQGPPRCDGQIEAPCPFCVRVGGGTSAEEIFALLNDVQ